MPKPPFAEPITLFEAQAVYEVGVEATTVDVVVVEVTLTVVGVEFIVIVFVPSQDSVFVSHRNLVPFQK